MAVRVRKQSSHGMSPWPVLTKVQPRRGSSHGREGAFYDGKRAATRYFFARELPKVRPMLDLLASGDRTTVDLDPSWL